MDIKTKDDWWKLAEATIPLLPEYAQRHNGKWPEAVAVTALKHKDHKKLYNIFNDLWFVLPDNASIRHQPFFDLCDLCSEYWVFSENQPDAEMMEVPE